jgi:hypothetical protein
MWRLAAFLGIKEVRRHLPSPPCLRITPRQQHTRNLTICRVVANSPFVPLTALSIRSNLSACELGLLNQFVSAREQHWQQAEAE